MNKYVVALCLGLSGCFGVIPDSGPPQPSTAYSIPSFGGDHSHLRWTQMDADLGAVCGLSTSGEVECRFEELLGYDLPEGNDFVQLTIAGYREGCALDGDGEVACFAKPGSRLLSEIPQGPFASIAGMHFAPITQACALRESGEVACWGDEEEYGPPADERFVQLSGGDYRWCGVREDASLACWDVHFGDAGSFMSDVPEGSFDEVVVGDESACARAGTEFTCWGNLPGDEHPDVPLQSARLGYSNICGVHPDGTGECWGSNGWGIRDVPNELFQQVIPLREEACGLRADGGLVCWGFDLL